MINEMLPSSPFFDYTEAGYGNAVVINSADGGKQILPFNPGFTKYEEVLLRFMVSTHSTCMETMTPADVAKAAHNFTTAYFAQVQKYEQEQSAKTNNNGK